MKKPFPDFAWYSAESVRLRLKSPRCPFASVHACPRYYQSLSLLGDAGCTSIPKVEDAVLKEKWGRHPLWPATGEQASAISGGSDGPNAYHQFCPEVAYDTFHLFATFLARHVGEIDRALAAEQLAKEGAQYGDWRWTWSAYKQQHYSECPLYSVLSHDWLKLIPQTEPLSATRNNPPPIKFDVFISHASEDKDDFVRPLAAALARMGLTVWFDELTLMLGDSLRQKIDGGLAASKYGVVVLSQNFFAKKWPQAELDGLFARELQGTKVILPIWHNLVLSDILQYSPMLASKLAVSTNEGFEVIAKRIFEVVRPHYPS